MTNYQIITRGRQTTLKKSFTISGCSALKNKKVVIKCGPAAENSGLIFRFGQTLIPARADFFQPTDWHTTALSFAGQTVTTVEHLLSAFYGLGVDNALIEIVGDNQLSLLDGSSRLYAEAISRAGIRKQSAARKIITIIEPQLILSENDRSFALILPAQQLKIRALINFNNLIGYQDFCASVGGKKYGASIAAARTFFIEAFNKKRWRELRAQFKFLHPDPKQSPIIAYDEKKYLTKLRFFDEPVRHKILDMVGDLALLGRPLHAEIIVYRPGHAFTIFLVKKILAELEK